MFVSVFVFVFVFVLLFERKHLLQIMNFRLQHQSEHHYDDRSDHDWNNHRPGRIKNLRMIFDNKGLFDDA